MKKLIAGSRGSKLALIQTQTIAKMLGCEVDIKHIVTLGDKITDVALAKIEGKAFFTREIDEALLKGEVDFAVHSYKDIPTDIPEGITIGAVPARNSPRDALVSKYSSFKDMPSGAKVGTSSLRRKSEVLHLKPDLEVLDLRGNLDTRLRKVEEGQYDAIIVAEAGLERFGYTDYHSLDPVEFIPTACQGALAVTARTDDKDTLELLEKLEDKKTRLACNCERKFLTAMEGGCQIPAGVYTEIAEESDVFKIIGFISSIDGKKFLQADESGSIDEADKLTEKIAAELLDAGGREILEEIRIGGA
jgi:hydroxymethylbilane synthase